MKNCQFLCFQNNRFLFLCFKMIKNRRCWEGFDIFTCLDQKWFLPLCIGSVNLLWSLCMSKSCPTSRDCTHISELQLLLLLYLYDIPHLEPFVSFTSPPSLLHMTHPLAWPVNQQHHTDDSYGGKFECCVTACCFIVQLQPRHPRGKLEHLHRTLITRYRSGLWENEPLVYIIAWWLISLRG